MASLSVSAKAPINWPLHTPTFHEALEAVLRYVRLYPGANVTTVKNAVCRESEIDATVVSSAVNIARLDGLVRVEQGVSKGILLFPKGGAQ